MKKILAILAILAFSIAQASQPVIYGIGAAHKSGIAVFNSLGKKDGEWTGTVGVYYTFGAK